jgi:hypothetical protein
MAGRPRKEIGREERSEEREGAMREQATPLI